MQNQLMLIGTMHMHL